jgi:hypothetical protein
MKKMHTKHFLILFGLPFLVLGCAGVAPVPGGGDTVNGSFYKSEDDLKTRVDSLKEGMTQAEVFAKLNRKKDDFIALGRDEIMAALYGGQQYAMSTFSRPDHNRQYIQSLSGYKFTFKNIKRKHGVSSPISMRTHENGYHYTTTLIFKDGVLYEKPILSGGIVNASSSKTLFDYLNLGSVVGRAGA